MIHITCRNCGWGLFGKAVMRVDAASVDITCPRCGEVYRVSAVKLHDGDPKFKGFANARGDDPIAYTYDEKHDRAPLPKLSRPPVNEG